MGEYYTGDERDKDFANYEVRSFDIADNTSKYGYYGNENILWRNRFDN
jgi:hypothetical protein